MTDHFRKFLCHHRRSIDIRQKLIQLCLSLYAPDRQHIIILCQERICRRGIIDQPARQSFHGNKSHICLLTFFHQFDVLLSRQITERKLQRLVQSAVNRLVRHRQTMIRNTDMSYLSFFFRLKRRVIQAALISRLRAERRIMELV